MRYGVLGTGMVGHALAGKLVERGHEVMMGARQAGNEKAVAWVVSAGPRAQQGSFADAAQFSDMVINATGGTHSLEALEAAGAENLSGKVLVDVANALTPDSGFPPTLSVCNTDSLAEQIQRAFPDTRVVKTLNTVNISVMVDPGAVPGSHAIFLSGNDADAKRRVSTELLNELGWPDESIYDLGDISTARGTEMYMGLWLRLLPVVGGPRFNIEIRRG